MSYSLGQHNFHGEKTMIHVICIECYDIDCSKHIICFILRDFLYHNYEKTMDNHFGIEGGWWRQKDI